MTNGLIISKQEFLKLPIKRQNLLLFENTEQLKIMIKSYKIHQKVQWGAITGILIVLGFSKYMGVM